MDIYLQYITYTPTNPPSDVRYRIGLKHVI